MKKGGFFLEPVDVQENQSPHYLVFPTSQCGFAVGRRRGVAATESRRPGFMCSCSCRAPHVQDEY
jgi:hypothetical protein